jgi:uncharacterized protein (TIGR03086 family)
MSTVSPPRPVVVLDGAITWTHGSLQLAAGQPLSLATPCRDWDLGRLLEHMDDSLLALGEAAELGHVSVDPLPRRRTTANLVDRLVQRACRTRAAWQERITSAPISVGDLPLDRSTLLLVGALEIGVHGWDVGRACGDERPIPDELAVPLLETARTVVTWPERGRRFAPPVPVDSAAPSGARLLGHLGREPGWTPQQA